MNSLLKHIIELFFFIFMSSKKILNGKRRCKQTSHGVLNRTGGAAVGNQP